MQSQPRASAGLQSRAAMAAQQQPGKPKAQPHPAQQQKQPQ